MYTYMRPGPPASLSRAAALKFASIPLAALLASPAAPARAVIGESILPGYLQADDKSWDVTLPAAWKASAADMRAEPEHRFHLRAERSSGAAASLDVFVDVAKGKQFLSDLGKVDEVGRRYAERFGTVQRAAAVPGPVRGSTYYEYEFAGSTTTTRAKLTVYQSRLYMLLLTLPSSAPAEVLAEADAISSSFKAFPVNMFCLAASNGGTAPTPGTCY